MFLAESLLLALGLFSLVFLISTYCLLLGFDAPFPFPDHSRRAFNASMCLTENGST